MAINNIDNANISLGKLLQIVFSDGVRLQISEDFKDWEMINRFKVPASPARQINFMFQNSLNPASVSSRDPGRGGSGSNANFPQGFQPSIAEHTAYMKMLEATIELEYDLWDRAKKSPEKYTEPLALVVNSVMTSTKRHLASQLYGDGTGVVGTVASAAVTSPASDKLVFTLGTTRGGANLFEYGDILILKAAAGTASALDTSLATEAVYWKVVEKDRDNGTVTLQGLTAAFAAVATITAISVQPTSGDVFYKFQQQIIPDLSAITDYGTATDALTGLGALASNDGRLVHGITMSGANAASILDASGNPLDVKHIHKALDKVKLAVGSNYKFPQMVMSPEALYTLIESRETDRRFQTIDDNKRGVKSFAYIHANDTVECVSSEFIGLKEIVMVPEGKASGQKVLSYAGSDFEPIRAQNGDEFRLKVDSNGYKPVMQSVMHGYGVLICNHPAAIAKVKNFTVS